ncbi:hypothetical protein AcV5_005427 [Taiwanofungus camphoratus]|nr:hypothetical protein AcV5_005427 [Antrodia cinnamomea]
MYSTAWTKGSSLPSDRIPPPKANTSSSKGKAKQKDPPRSKKVRRLEDLRNNLRNSNGTERDPKGGCFCQARVHKLSSYTPICKNCGLILCELHLPYYACPHCAAPLLTPSAHDALVATIETQIADTLAKEEEERERAIEEARAAAGAFPSLSAAASGNPVPDPLSAHPANQTHKVLSLNAKTKKATVSSYAPPAIPRAASRDNDPKEEAEEQERVPPPPPSVVFVDRNLDPRRPWANLRNSTVTYVPLPRSDAPGDSRSGSSKQKRKESSQAQKMSKGKEVQNQKV